MALNFKKIWTGLTVVPKTATSADSKGELEVIDSTGKLQYHNGTSVSPILTEAHSATITNKVIDADDNTISDLEVDNLKAGVLNTSTSLAGATDAQVPSALAVKTYVDNSSGAVQTDVDDLITLSGVPANSTDLGTFTGTTIPDASPIKSALQSLETSLEAHVADATDAHDASAISNVPSGNLAATDIQGAVNELQSDIDTINGSLSGFVTGPASSTDNHIVRFDGTTGKLVQDSSPAVLSDAGSLSGLTGVSSSGTAALADITASGSTTLTGTLDANGLVQFASTNDAASGSNATLTSPTTKVIRLTNASLVSIDGIPAGVDARELIIENATGTTVVINEDTGGTAANRFYTGTTAGINLADKASLFISYDTTSSRWRVIGGSGSGTGSQALDTFVQLDASELLSTWATGDNVTFLGGGTLAGTFVKNTSTPLNGTASYLYTQAASSLDDYLASPVQSVPIRFRGNQVTCFFPYTYDGGSSDIEPIIYDVTNSTKLTTSTNLLPATPTTGSIYKVNVTIPPTCTQIRVGFHVKILNSGKILEVDDIQISSDTTKYADPSTITEWQSFTPTGTMTTNTTYQGRYRRVGSDVELKYFISFAGAPNTTTLSVNLPTGMTIDANRFPGGISTQNYNLGRGKIWDNSTATPYELEMQYATSTSLTVRVSRFSALAVDDAAGLSQATPVTIAVNDEVVLEARLPISGWTASNPQIITASDSFSSDTASLVYASSSSYTLSTLTDAPIGTFITFTYAASGNTRTQTTTAPTQTTSHMNTHGIQLFPRAFNATSTAGNPTAIAIQIGKAMKGTTLELYKSTSKAGSGELDFNSNSSFSAQYGMSYKNYDAVTGILYLDAAEAISSGNTTREFKFNDATTQGNGYIVINASKSPALVGVPQVQPRFATISDVKAANTNGGSFTSGAFQTRTLNTLVDSTGIVTSLASNQFTLPAGTYYIDASAPGYTVDRHQTKIRNITDSTDDLIGSSDISNSGGNQVTRSVVNGQIIITGAKTFELQHRCQTTQAAGFGLANNFGVNEVYAIVKITKIK